MAAAPEIAAESPKYRIGTIVQLTGLTADTIRAWERRYGSISPIRTPGGTRLYSDEDVTRLQLMHALTEVGNPISSIAQLPTDDLRARLAKLVGDDAPQDAGSDEVARPHRIAVLDPALSEQLQWNAAEAARLEVAFTASDLASFVDRAAGERADVVVVHLAQLGSNPLDGLASCLGASGADLAVVVYDFASRRQLAQLSVRGARLIRGPVSVSQLRAAIEDLSVIREVGRRRGMFEEPSVTPPRPTQEPPARIYTDEQMARLREVQSSVDCECPTHLAQIVTSLVAFERYSAACESRNPEDAALHAALARGTGHARAQIEQLLTRLCEHDGIKL